ncbi:MAG: efflux RND transporter periplasmic adaptor subunit [Chitinophagaceae bacterium]|nr:efflux RND transporter periplasmic adaptor subunit [Chitinophagaceae bacterium]
MTNKLNDMNTIVKISFVVIIAASLVACGGGTKDEKGKIGDLKVKLEKLKKEKNGLDEQIRQLEDQILKADPEAAKAVQKLISADTLRIQDFAHYIELQGKIDADGVAYVAPNGMGGLVKAVYVKLGQRVSKGQVILKLDDVLARQAVVAAQQQAEALKAQLAQAESVYQRQQNLWKENIGSEIQVINARTAVETLQSQLRAAQAQAKGAQEQADQTNVRAEISGVIDEMDVKPGQLFTAQTAATPGAGIRIVNNSSVKIVTAVPENYVARVKHGDAVLVEVPETGKPAFKSVINVVGASIDAKTRSFTTEARLPSDPLLKPNQLATMKILDYQAKAAVTVPTNLVQTDEKGKYVYVIEKATGKNVARKKTVTVGETYNGITEIKNGLTGGELLITEGYQTVYDGQSVTTGK